MEAHLRFITALGIYLLSLLSQIQAQNTNFFNCTFQDGNKCGWDNGAGASVLWQLTRIPPVSAQTYNLIGDHTNGNGYFWTATRTPSNYPGNRVFLEFPVKGPTGKLMHFWYHMSGQGVGSLTVEILPIGLSVADGDSKLSIQGNQGYAWLKATDIPVGGCTNFKVRIEAQLGTEINTNIAIDDITFSDYEVPHLHETTAGSYCFNDALYVLQDYINKRHSCCCASGFQGSNCQVNIDECYNQGYQACINQATCNDVINGFTCTCKPGFTGQYCNININECDSTQCEHGQCQDNVAKFTCLCDAGWTAVHCEVNIDDCVVSNCENGGTCMDKLNGFDCQCQPGFTGQNCETNVDDCNPNHCASGSTCFDASNDYDCVCPPGRTGKNCDMEVNECESDPCIYGSCVDNLLSYTCNCDVGFTGRHCEHNMNDCIGNQCQNNAICEDGINRYTCHCKPGFAGAHCSLVIDECQENNDPCQNGATCTSQTGSYICSCVPGYTGQHCEIQINECQSNPCVEGICVDQVNGYQCQCTAGFEGIHCENNIQDCIGQCQNGGSCFDLVNGYKCICQAGWSGLNCNVDVDECSNVQCQHGGTCENLQNDFKCTCASNYIGKYCETNVNDPEHFGYTSDQLIGGRGSSSVNGQYQCSVFSQATQALQIGIIIVCTVICLFILILGLIIVEIRIYYIKKRIDKEERRFLYQPDFTGRQSRVYDNRAFEPTNTDYYN